MSEQSNDTNLVKATPRNLYKIDVDKLVELREKKVSMTDIAKTLGVHKSTVSRFIKKYRKDLSDLQLFRHNRAFHLQNAQYKAMKTMERLATALLDMDDSKIAQLGPEQNARVQRDLSVVKGTLYDKERLETGQSTANVAVNVEQALSDALRKSQQDSNESVANDDDN